MPTSTAVLATVEVDLRAANPIAARVDWRTPPATGERITLSVDEAYILLLLTG